MTAKIDSTIGDSAQHMVIDTNAPVKSPKVGLFVTCLVDLYRPSVGFASISLLEAAGCEVTVPVSQTCCGQPAFNSGDKVGAAKLAEKLIMEFEAFDYVVAPSGSCIAMLREFPSLFKAESDLFRKAELLSKKSFEITSFLVDVVDFGDISTCYKGTMTYHDSCSGLRALNIKQQPRKLLNRVKDLNRVEMPEPDVCCGFGGTFCTKYSEISNQMVSNKVKSIVATNADLLVSGEMGCLLNIVGKLKKEKKSIQARHVVELLIESLLEPAIAEVNDAS